MKQNNIWFSLVLAFLLWAFIPQQMMAEEVHVSNYQEFKEQVGRSDGKTMTIVLDDDIVVDETLEGYGGFCIIPWIKMLNYTSNSTKLS